MGFFNVPKTSISLRLTSGDVCLLKLDKEERRILGLYQQLLPGGWEEKSLSETIQKVIMQAEVKGETALIVIPEEKVFLTIVDTKKMQPDEVAEAVGWAAEEALPGSLDNFDWDWKWLEEKNKALVMAINKAETNWLMRLARNCGLKPIGIEPLSMSLSRLQPGNETTMMIEIRPNQTTIAVTDGRQNPLFSTVINNPGKILETLQQVSDYWNKKYLHSISRALVLGEGATDQWISFIAEKTGIKTERASFLTPIANLPPNPERFWAIMSAGWSTLTLPQETKTINLLPQELIKEYETVSEKKALSGGFKASLAITGLTAIMMLATFGLIQLKSRQTQTQIVNEEDQVQQTAYTQLAKEAEIANSLANTIKRLPKQTATGAIINALEKAKGNGITLNDWVMNTAEKVLLVNGKAETRDQLLKFKSNLEASETFDLVSIPLPTLEQQNEIQFSIAIEINKQVL